MLSTDNQRQCSRCEEYIHPQSTSCPYCGTDLTAPKTPTPAVAAAPNPLVMQPHRPLNTLAIPASPYASPYNPSANPLPPSPEIPFTQAASPKISKEKNEEAQVNSSSNSVLQTIVPLLLLLSGAVFSLFGAILALYSENGVFTLHWKSSYWPLYLGLSLPLLFFGWRTLNTLDD